MFQLLPCSNCQRTFSVRGEVSEAALLRCPSCGNQFRIGELLDALYAPWQIVEDPGASGGHAPAALSFAAPAAQASNSTAVSHASAVDASVFDQSTTEFSVGSNRDLEVIEEETLAGEPVGGLSLDGDEAELRLVEEAIDESAAATKEGIEAAGLRAGEKQVDWSKFKPISQEEYKRLRRGTRSGTWSALQAVLGGVAAIPVTLLLLWYVLGKDVAGAGPAVAQYLPWIVPQQFHGTAPELPRRRSGADARASQNSVQSPSQKSRQDSPERGDSEFRNFDDVLPLNDQTAESSLPTSEANPQSAEVEKSLSGEATEDATPGDTAADSTTPAGDTSADLPTITPSDLSDLSDSTAGTTSTSASKVAPGASQAPTFSPAEVFALLKRTKDKVVAWPEVADAQPAAKRQAAIDLFEDLANLGVQLSMQADGRGAPQLMHDRTQDICREIKGQSGLVEVLHNAAKAQLNGALPRSKDGWVLVCTIDEALEVGNAWRVSVSDPALVPLKVPTIEIPKRALPQAATGQRVILLGRFVSAEDNPTASQGESAPKGEVFRASFSYGL